MSKLRLVIDNDREQPEILGVQDLMDAIEREMARRDAIIARYREKYGELDDEDDQ